jgi:hypothetical protein
MPGPPLWDNLNVGTEPQLALHHELGRQMAMSPTTFSQFVMLRLRHSNLKLAIAALQEIYKDEAQHVAHDITAKLCALPLEGAVAADSESLDDEPLFPPRDPDEEPQ